MKRKTPIIAMLALVFGVGSATAEGGQTGMRDLSISDENGDRHLKGFVWYPTDESAGATFAMGNAVWEPIQVVPEAVPVAGQKPLLVMSHGMFGNARNQAWLAQAMTEKGYIVAAIDHPGTTTFQRDPKDQRELWERPKDMSRTIDYLLTSDAFGGLIDPSRIYMAGHSLGGFTAVALAGGRYDPARVDANCAADPGELICRIFSGFKVAKTPEDRSRMAADLSDARIKGFAVFDLGGTQTFSPESLAAIDRPVLVIGAPLDIHGLDLEVESRALVKALTGAKVSYREPEELAHFDFLGVCTEKGLAILQAEEPEDAFVCANGREERRREHGMIARDVAQFFAGL